MANALVHVLENIPIHPVSLLAFLSFIIFLYKWQFTKYQIPSPRKLPIIGNLHQFGTLPHQSLRTMSQKYGDLMLLHLGNRPTLVVSSASLAEEIMKTHDTIFATRSAFKVVSLVMYDGRDVVFSRYGEYWRQMKSICVLHMLSNKKVQSFRKIREEEVSAMVDRIRKTTPSNAVNMTDNFATFTNDVVSRAAFGRKYDGEVGSGNNIKELLNDFVKVFCSGIIGDFIPWLGWIDHLTGVLRTATRVGKAFDAFLDKIVQDHIDNYDNNVDDDHHKREETDQDFVDVLLKIQRSEPSLKRESIKALLLDMVAGGIESISTLLEWTMSELLMNESAMKIVQDEVRGFSKGKTIINEDDLKNMKYLKAVIKEALRLHPPTPLIVFRESSQDVKIQNHDIPAGTQVIINMCAIHTNPISWDQPEEFRPERFLDCQIDIKGQDFKYVPFGAGKRGCPGISFSTVKAELLLANLVGQFDWKLPNDVQADSFMAEDSGGSVHRRHPLMAIPTPYSPI